MSRTFSAEKVVSAEQGAFCDASARSANVLTRKSAVATAGGILGQGLKFFVYLYIARTFSSADFGSIAFANAVNAFIFIASQFGLPVYGSRVVASSGKVESRLLFSVAVCRAALALAGTAAALGILAATPGVLSRDYALVAFFGLSNLPLAAFFDWAFQGLNRQVASALLNAAWQFFWLGFTYVGVQVWKNIIVVPVALCVAAFLASLVSFIWLRFLGLTDAREDRGAGGLSEVIHVLRKGHLLGTGTVLLSVIVWADTITVRLLVGEQAAGWYAAGNRAALAISWLANAYMRGAFPLLCSASQTAAETFRLYFQRAYNELALLFMPVSVWGLFFAPQVILFLFKRNEYLAGVPVFRIFQIVIPLIVFNFLYGTGVLLAFHEDREYRRILIVAAVTLVVVCPISTHFWGLEGAAISTLLTYVVSIGLFHVRARHHVRPRHAEALLLPCLAGLAAGLAGVFLHAGLFSALALLALAYGALLVRHRRQTREYAAI
jgi:O-antigen/teichoic acid export membrane protein